MSNGKQIDSEMQVCGLLEANESCTKPTSVSSDTMFFRVMDSELGCGPVLQCVPTYSIELSRPNELCGSKRAGCKCTEV